MVRQLLLISNPILCLFEIAAHALMKVCISMSQSNSHRQYMTMQSGRSRCMATEILIQGGRDDFVQAYLYSDVT